MAGIYIHIPFCRRKCSYCDFYKSTKIEHTDLFVEVLQKEALLRRDELNNEPVKTVYFGGGTPSVLSERQIAFIFRFLTAYFSIQSDAEITFEVNPDDLNAAFLGALKSVGINRLSIGIQSFYDEHLKVMNRRHNAQQALYSIKDAWAAGFTNLSVDLIYGLPGLTLQQWKKNLKILFHYPVDHLSAYHLTYHDGTPFYKWLKEGVFRELSEKESVAQFNLLLEESGKAGFEHYEISNFARQGMYAKHNTAYWTGEAYLGLGPSAHSYNGDSRRWNVASLENYIRTSGNGQCFWEEEHLTERDKFNEFILTRLRTKWGVSKDEIKERFGEKKAVWFASQATGYLSSGKMQENDGCYTLTREGLFISDSLMTNFMFI